MQGNWNGSSGGVGGVPTSATSAAVAVAAGGTTVTLASKGQQQQHQGLLQQINGEIHHHGTTAGRDIIPHSPTTPAWNIADRIVKEELPEDKNNDSGVSPGHYTSNSVSPRSRRSSSTANGSLSPGSATSQDSSAMQYEYSPQRLFKSYGGNDLSALHNNGSNRSLQLGQNRDMEQPVDVVSSTMKQESDDSDNSHQTSNMQCPVCPFNTAHRMQFNDHLTSHCAPSKRESSAEYSPSSYVQEDGARGSPSQGERSEREFDDDEPGLRVPQQNCQGKVKTFKCKQCNFVAVTKLAFWEHSRVHIKAEKLLTCPRCPFVTAYKHHLEYHLRNHFNSKPFKCDICPYSCVNQSMLNSHSKSHSNVYQYRCAECSYATKYCHSLKLHLRKYKHNPAMVLNPDGSPNPLPIIDIYGTRRGPKQKPTRKTSNEDANNKSNSATQNSAGIKIAAQFPSEHNLIQNSGLTLNVPFSYGQFFNAVGNSMPTIGAGNGSVGHFLHQFHDSNHNLQNDNRNNKQFDLFGFKLNDDYNDVKRMTNSPVGSSLQQPFSNSNSINSNNSKSTTELFYESSPTALTDEPEVVDMSLISSSPLDLSKPEIGTKNHKTNSPRGGGTSRRKGKAFKLDKLIVARDSEDDDNDDDSGSNKIFQEPMITDFVRENVVVGNIKSENNNHDDRDVIDCNDDDGASGNGDNNVSSGGNNSDYNCQYCDIAFGNVVMYTMHMGYHGYKNPYTCNMCGHECADKVSFFLHIARDSHS